jgi:hypothetical protein
MALLENNTPQSAKTTTTIVMVSSMSVNPSSFGRAFRYNLTDSLISLSTARGGKNVLIENFGAIA